MGTENCSSLDYYNIYHMWPLNSTTISVWFWEGLSILNFIHRSEKRVFVLVFLNTWQSSYTCLCFFLISVNISTLSAPMCFRYLISSAAQELISPSSPTCENTNPSARMKFNSVNTKLSASFANHFRSSKLLHCSRRMDHQPPIN